MIRKKFETILITGSQGFLGSHILERLLLKKNVIGVNKILDKKRIGYKQIRNNIEKISSDQIKVNFDGVIHLAAITDVKYCEENPNVCFMTNIIGTQKVLELARKKDCKFIYMSTSHVYGKPDKLPISENDPKNPESIYAASKLAGEICCESYSKTYGMDVSILRVFSVYGPRSPTHLVTSRILSQLSEKSLSLGNTHTKRDFVFIDDVIDAVEIISRKSRGLQIFNVGTGQSYSILKICEILQKLAQRKIPIKSQSKYSRKNDINEIVSDSSKLKKLGWKPKIDIQKGLKLTYDWHRLHFSAIRK